MRYFFAHSRDKEDRELLFKRLSMQARSKSTIVTTNLAFDRLDEIIKEKILANALVYRLTHNAYLVNKNSVPYRLNETRDFNQRLRKNVKIVFLKLKNQTKNLDDNE